MEQSLPDFLRLSDEQIAAERERQSRLRRDFHNRVRMPAAEEEMARAAILADDLKETWRTSEGPERSQMGDRVAENLAQQGRFSEALHYVYDPHARDFYAKAAQAVFGEPGECKCGGSLERVIDGQTRIKLPKYSVKKEIYNINFNRFGFLAECNGCGRWVFLPDNPLPAEIDPKDFDPATTPNDIQRLKA